MLKLLIREIKPDDHNGRYLRENLRRIEQYLQDVQSGKTTLIKLSQLEPVTSLVYYEQQEVTVDGQVNFTLSHVPADPSKVRMIVNSCEMSNGRHFVVVGQVVTFDPVEANFQLEETNELGQPDIIIFEYMV